MVIQAGPTLFLYFTAIMASRRTDMYPGKGLIIDFHLIIIFWLGPLAQW